MSKVNRFSLEERYGYQNRKVIYDKGADDDIELNSIYPIIDLLNKFDRQIAELKKQLKEKEKEIKTYRQREYILMEQVSFVSLNVERLEQQLQSQPAEIVEKIRNICSIEDKCKDGSFVLGINEKDLDNLLKEYQK